MSCCDSSGSCCPTPAATNEVQKDETQQAHETVKEYYGKTLQNTDDLQTGACTACAPMPPAVRDVVNLIHFRVLEKFYGCGLVVPQKLENASILDLGCGAGRDCYILSKLVGENGRVVGVDMTEEMISVAINYVDYHTKKFGYSKPNVEFKRGFIEDLKSVGLPDNTFDVIVSNCVINLCANKEAVLREAYRVLKQGGELYFSDVYSDRRVPKELVQDPVLYGECLSGALYWNDFITLAKKVGFTDPRLVESAPIPIKNSRINSLIGHIKFFSATYRLFKIDGLDSACEDYGQAVIYKGNLPESPNAFVLDGHHTFEKGKVVTVCGNSFDMLNKTRFADCFQFIGDKSVHYGIFPGCGQDLPFSSGSGGAACKPTGGCC